jgi:hypothetical protein
MNLSTVQLSAWLHRYFIAWQSNKAEDVSGLFAEEAVYYYGPFKESARGRDAIVANWVSNPEGQTKVVYDFNVLATEGNLGVVHWNVTFYSELITGEQIELDGILVLKFNSAMQCTEHREWYSRREV